jgi:poly-gamma-glutamate synthesis protein (capsule biosynthesis protein)
MKRVVKSVSLAAVGDILAIAGAGAAMRQYGDQYPFEPVTEILASADLVFGNLEMAIRPDASQKPHFADVCPDFYSPPGMAHALKMAGFTVINLANNHMMDWGVEGLDLTVKSLHAAGVATIGAGCNLSEARYPAIVMCNNLRVGFLGYSEVGPWVATNHTAGVAPLNRAMILQDIARLRPQVDLLIVSLHTGCLSDYPSPEDRQLAHDSIQQGADLILGHGPHVVQGIETYQQRVIVYSMGNFMIDLASGNVENKTMLREHLDSLIIQAALVPGIQPEVDFTPVVISPDFQVRPADAESAARIRTRVARISVGLEQMNGLAFMEHAGALNVEHQLRVMAFQWKQVSWRLVLARLTKVRWRHVRLLLGYLMSRIRQRLRAVWAVDQADKTVTKVFVHHK